MTIPKICLFDVDDDNVHEKAILTGFHMPRRYLHNKGPDGVNFHYFTSSEETFQN